MSNLIKAKSLLVGDNTIALVKENNYYTSTKNGITPMLEFIEKGYNLEGFSVADKVVGKAVAMLFSYAKITSVHAITISKPALDYLTSHKINVTYDKLVDNIQNRLNNGLCPMEQTVKDIDDSKVALDMLKVKVLELRNGTH